MEPDEEHDDDRSPGPLLPPDDRLWRHPSELAFTSQVTSATPAASLIATSGARGGADGRLWSIALLSGVLGALLATAAVYAVGGPTHQVAVPALERDVD
ncbi:MAG: hypothetical protein ACHQNA_12065, partial [Acidimicrobiales bacterium]